MSKKDEALKLALEALKQMQAMANFECWNLDICDEAITAIREALAEQPAQQEWPKPKFVRNVDGVPCITFVEHEYLMRSRTSPPASKPWVGLTDEEIMAIGRELGLKCRLGGNPNIDFDYARAIEAKLREKNA